MKQITTGTENFKEMIDNNYYYIDKTMLIEDVFKDKVMLYTRPRRFGKTLNLSMLYYFFSNKEKENAYLFNNLKIKKNEEAIKHQNQYPVISISLKDLKNKSFDAQKSAFSNLLFQTIEKHLELFSSEKISDAMFRVLKDLHYQQANEEQLKSSLKILSQALYQLYGQKVIILIDEYDVPLQSAYVNDYYDDMVEFLRGILSAGLKTNEYLERGVLTGCLRIAKESIFTGLNNFTVRSILDREANDCFGFTQNEIDEVLEYYHLNEKKAEMKEWYDGYDFCGIDIYNPWSSLNFISKLNGNCQYRAEPFWANTSSNDIVREYIEIGTKKTREEFEHLVNDKSVYKQIKPELTYREMDFEDEKGRKRINDDIYSFLLYTGYLKTTGKIKYDNDIVYHEVVIPNKEVKFIYKNQFQEWFHEYEMERKNHFIECLLNENTEEAMELLSDVLESSISYYDNQESFYHGFLIGFLQECGYDIQSNKESGTGRFDIALVPGRRTRPCIILECKHSLSGETLVGDSQKAVKQISEKHYKAAFLKQGYPKVLGYGISFYKKQCYITKD